MAESFEDLGLRAELARAAAEGGYAAPTPLQRATIPLLRRGGNAVIHASSGAGLTAAWGLPLLDRLSSEPPEGEAAEATTGGTRLLALLPTAEEAGRAAVELAPFAQAAGMRLLALAPGWAPLQADADVVLAAVGDALRAVESSELKLDGLAAFVVAGASSLVALRGAEALDTLTASVPKAAQRILTSGELSRELDDYVERHIRRPLWIPHRPAEEAAPPEAVAKVGYAVLGENEKLDWVAREIRPGTVLFCRSDDRAATVASSLMLRGFRVGAAGEADTDIAVASATADPRELPGGHTVSFDVPFDAGQLTARHAGREGAVLVLPRELPHLRRTAFEAGFALRPLTAATTGHGLETFRQRLRDALRDEDLEAQLLILQPLFEERSAAEIAAAASALLRRKAAAGARPDAIPGPGVGGVPPTRRPARPSAGAGTAPASYTRLFVSVGQRDNLRPGDLVGAIAGEAGVPGERVGRIEVRDTFSIVEVPAEDADRIIRAVNGTTLKGRSVRVDYDRRRSTPARRPGGPGGAGGRPRRE